MSSFNSAANVLLVSLMVLFSHETAAFLTQAVVLRNSLSVKIASVSPAIGRAARNHLGSSSLKLAYKTSIPEDEIEKSFVQEEESLSRDDKLDMYQKLFEARQAGQIDTEELRQSVDGVALLRSTSFGMNGVDVVGHSRMPRPTQQTAVGIPENYKLKIEEAQLLECEEVCVINDGVTVCMKKDEGTAMPVALARIMVLGSAAFYGTNFGSVKLLEESLSPSLAAALRFTLAAIAMSPLLRTLRPEALKDGLTIGAIVATGYIAQGLSLQTADASTAAFLCSLAVIVCPLLDAFSGKEVSKQAWAAAGLAVGGAAFLELGGSSAPGMGDLLALVQPLAFGAGFWRTEKAMRKHPGQTGPLAALQVGVVAAVAGTWCLFESHGLPSSEVLQTVIDSPQVVTALLWTGLVTTAFTVFLETVALGALSSAETTVLFSTEPLWGTAFASVVLNEQIGSNTIVGGSLILAACIGRTAGPQILKAGQAVWDRVVGREMPSLQAKIAAGIAAILTPDVSDVL